MPLSTPTPQIREHPVTSSPDPVAATSPGSGVRDRATGRGRSRRVGPGLAALGLAGCAVVGGAGSAAADPQAMGRCTTKSGVVLAVDMSHWGGPVLRSCGTTPTTGYTLLNQGGWRTTGTGHDGPAFICRIGFSGYHNGAQYPTPAQDSCVLTPPASAYWSYWHADPGQNTWTYSQLGAMLYKPKPGSVDLWSFGGTNIGGTKGRPTISPDQLRAHSSTPEGGTVVPRSTSKAPQVPPGVNTGPAPEKPVTKQPATPPPASGKRHPKAGPKPGPRTSAGARPRPSGSATADGKPTASATAEATTAASTPAPVAATAHSGTQVVDAAPSADARSATGSVVPVATGAALVVGIGAAAFFTALRGRGQAE